MLNRRLVGAVLGCVPAALLIGGCAHCRTGTVVAEVKPFRGPPRTTTTVERVADVLPPNAKPGECFVKVFVPEQFETTTKQVCVREASERLEIVPAQYEWVEERIVVKDASTILEEEPAQFAAKEETILTEPGHTSWVVEKTARCVTDTLPNATEDMFCLVTHEPEYRTISKQVMVQPPRTREVTIPAEYQTVRRQKLVTPACTKRVAIPAEYTSVEETRKVADSRIEWRRAACVEKQAERHNFNDNFDNNLDDGSVNDRDVTPVRYIPEP